jgi:hypothetical protein
LFRVGAWSKDFDGRPFDGHAALPAAMAEVEATGCADRVIAHLREHGIVPQERAVDTIGWDQRSAAPPAMGRCHLLDGTQLALAGEKEVTGDPIRTTLAVGKREATFDCLGVAAVRLAEDGSLDAMAAGGLKHLRAGHVEITLDKPIDVALWRDAQGNLHGVLQDWPDPDSATGAHPRLAPPVRTAPVGTARARRAVDGAVGAGRLAVARRPVNHGHQPQGLPLGGAMKT